VTFVGSSHDDYDDGRFDDLVELRFARGGKSEVRIVSVHAPARVDEVLDVRWNLQSAHPRELEIVLYPRVDARPMR
jgi:hypothetical protein